MRITNKRFGDPGSTQTQGEHGWFTVGSAPVASFGDIGHFTPTATDAQTAKANALLVSRGVTPADVQKNLETMYQNGLAKGMDSHEWYASEHDATMEWVDHGYTDIQAAGMLAATTANVKWSSTFADDTPNFAAGTTVYSNLTAAATCAAYVTDDPTLTITQAQADTINGAHAAGANNPTYGDQPMDANSDPPYAPLQAGQVQASALSDYQLGKYASMSGNSLIPGVPIGYPDSVMRGVEIARGADPSDVLTGYKEQSFMNNVAFPDEATTATIDSHMSQGMLPGGGTTLQGDDAKNWDGQGFPIVQQFDANGDPRTDPKGNNVYKDYARDFVGTPAGYTYCANLVVQTATAAGMVPNQYQAVAWAGVVQDEKSLKNSKLDIAKSFINAPFINDDVYTPEEIAQFDADMNACGPFDTTFIAAHTVTSTNFKAAVKFELPEWFKGFGDPGSTQDRQPNGTFGVGSTTPGSTAAGLKGNQIIAHGITAGLHTPEGMMHDALVARSEVSGLPTRDIGRIDGVWESSPTDSSLINLTLQAAAGDRFGSTVSPDLQARLDAAQPSGNRATNISQDTAASYIDAQYQTTQAWLAANNITEVTLYRGVTWNSQTDPNNPLATPMTAASAISSPSATINVTSNPLTSWSYDAQNAESFANGMTSHGVDSGAVVQATIPAANILAVPATGMASAYWQEVVVVTPPGGYDVSKIPSGADDGVTGRATKSAHTQLNLDEPPINEAWLRTKIEKGFNDPGSTQTQGPDGRFTAGNTSASDLEARAIAHFGAAEELQGQQFITPNGTILNLEGDGHDRITEVVHGNVATATTRAINAGFVRTSLDTVQGGDLGLVLEMSQPLTDAQQTAINVGIQNAGGIGYMAIDVPHGGDFDRATGAGEGANLLYSEDQEHPTGAQIAALIDGANAAATKSATKGFGDPGSTQERVGHGEFGPGSGEREHAPRLRDITIGSAADTGELAMRSTPITAPHITDEIAAQYAADHAFTSDARGLQAGESLTEGFPTPEEGAALADAMVAARSTKGFGDPGSTQDRTPGGTFTVGTGAPRDASNLKYPELHARDMDAGGTNSPLMTRPEFQASAARGEDIVMNAQANASPSVNMMTGDNIQAAVTASQQQWGGVTIDAHGGGIVSAASQPSDPLSVSMRDAGQGSVIVSAAAVAADPGALMSAMQQAQTQFATQLSSQGAALGMFRDETSGTVQFDPVLVVQGVASARDVGAYTGATGGAFRFVDSLGYWPGHVA